GERLLPLAGAHAQHALARPRPHLRHRPHLPWPVQVLRGGVRRRGGRRVPLVMRDTASTEKSNFSSGPLRGDFAGMSEAVVGLPVRISGRFCKRKSNRSAGCAATKKKNEKTARRLSRVLVTRHLLIQRAEGAFGPKGSAPTMGGLPATRVCASRRAGR